MLAYPRGRMYRGKYFFKLVFEVVDVFSAGMTVELVHNFRHHDGVDGLGDGRGGGSVGHFVFFAFTRY